MKKISKERAIAEKGGILYVAILITIGGMMLSYDGAQSQDFIKFVYGIALTLFGLAVLYIREKLKLNRWEHISYHNSNTTWRGDRIIDEEGVE